MKLFRTALLALLGVAFALPAGATINMRQNGDGTADWLGSRADPVPFFQTCVGGQALTTDIALGGGLATKTLISPITNAVIRNFMVSVPNNVTGSQNALISVHAGSQTTFLMGYATGNTITRIQLRVNTISGNLINYPTSNAIAVPRVFGISHPAQVGTVSQFFNTRLVSNTLMRGDPIFVSTDGGFTTGTATGSMVIYVCPR